MVCLTSIVGVVDTFNSLTVYAYSVAWMGYCACKAVARSLVKAFTACIVTVTGMLAADHDISFTAAFILIIGTV
jgi:hypothetical protein